MTTGKGLRIFILSTAAIMCVVSGSAFSQNDAASQEAAQKQSGKAARKMERKAARQRNDADLKDFESHGYNPGLRDNDYPAGVQGAEQRRRSVKEPPATSSSSQ